MAKRKEIGIYHYQYEMIGTEGAWTAYIAAYNAEEGEQYLLKELGRPIRLVTMGVEVDRLDAITDPVRNTIKKGILEELKLIKKSKGEEKPVVEKRDGLFCPFCSFEGSIEQGLKTHIKRKHLS